MKNYTKVLTITSAIATLILNTGCATLKVEVAENTLPDGSRIAASRFNQPKIPLLRSGIDNVTMYQCPKEGKCVVVDPSQGAVNVDGFLGDAVRGMVGIRQAEAYEEGHRGLKSQATYNSTEHTDIGVQGGDVSSETSAQSDAAGGEANANGGDSSNTTEVDAGSNSVSEANGNEQEQNQDLNGAGATNNSTNTANN